MKYIGQLLSASLLFSTIAAAQPVIRTQSAVVNSASYRTPGLPGSGIAQGSLFSIFGSGLGPNHYVQAQSFPLPTSLPDESGTSVEVTVAGTKVNALVVFTFQSQVNAILPSNTPVGEGTLTVKYNGQTSDPAAIEVVKSAFGIYTYSSSGAGQAIATDTNYAINTIIHTFHPGDVAILWGTGLGAGSDDAHPPVPGNIGVTNVYVGTTAAPVLYAGRASCCSGLDQIDFRIPAGVVGCHVPIAVETGGATSNFATIAISNDGQTCTDSIMGQDLVNKLASGQSVNFGYARLESLVAPFSAGQAYRSIPDSGAATFSRITPQTAGLAQYGVSSGYCITMDCSYGCGANTVLGTLPDSSPAQLDAGALTVGGQGVATLSKFGGFYGSTLGQGGGGGFLWRGLTYTVSGSGGNDVGTFSVTDRTGLGSVQFTNLSRGQAVPRSSDLTIQWSGEDTKLQNGQVTIGGYSADSTNYNQLVLFHCVAPASAHSFTIPKWVLSTIPPSGQGITGTVAYPLGWIWIGQYNTPVTFSADHLDLGIMTDAYFNGYGLYFQ